MREDLPPSGEIRLFIADDIHIRTAGVDRQAFEFVSQFLFDETLSDQVYSVQPYAAKSQRDTLNSSDNIYNNGVDQHRA